MTPESQELKDRITRLEDEQLLEMVASKAGEYREEAVGYAKAELEARGIDVAEGTDEAPQDQASGPFVIDRSGAVPVCLICGGRLRPGTLVGEKEITIVFTDNHEERFVKVNACTQCGQISLAVDDAEDVQP
jgi:hypothetical protein